MMIKFIVIFLRSVFTKYFNDNTTTTDKIYLRDFKYHFTNKLW